MARTSSLGAVVAAASVLSLVFACGGSGESSFGPGANDLNDNSSGGFGSSGSSGDGTSGNASSEGTSGGACAAQVAEAERVPAYI